MFNLCLILNRLAEEKTTLLKQCEDTVSLKAEETEQLRLRLEEAQQELLLAKNKVWTGNTSVKITAYLFQEQPKNHKQKWIPLCITI